MILKQSYQALEPPPLSKAVHGIHVKRMIKLGNSSYFNKLAKFSPFLLAEMDEFIERNSLVINGNNKIKQKHYCCPQCLKAHALICSREMKLGNNIEKIVNKLFEGEVGHGEYYLDGEVLIKV
ncbi:MAG: hypothetical protein Q7S74_03530 [Nanoarchaeota archaeon]|nr:hypothetical protein [Nanoarchaeota archaeon]